MYGMFPDENGTCVPCIGRQLLSIVPPGEVNMHSSSISFQLRFETSFKFFCYVLFFRLILSKTDKAFSLETNQTDQLPGKKHSNRLNHMKLPITGLSNLQKVIILLHLAYFTVLLKVWNHNYTQKRFYFL